jgi:uncharacterized protein with HEPN domain
VKDDRLYLGHIVEAAERILLYAAAGEESFRKDLMVQDAIVRNIQVMGEAVKKVSAETRAAHPELPWRDIAGMRDRVVHDYFGISLDIVWDVVKNHILPLCVVLRKLLPDQPRP